MKNFIILISFTVVLALHLGTRAFAVTKISSQSGNWSATSTWGGNPVPVAGDDVIIQGGFTVTVDIPNAECLSIQLGGSALNTGTGSISFMNGSALLVSGQVNIGPFNNNNTAGSLSMASGGTLVCEGIILGKLGTWTSGTGSIEFTATNTIPNDNNIIFNNLTVSGGTTSMPRNISVNGNLVIQPGGTFFGGVDDLTLGGDFTNDGTFTGNTGTVTFLKNGHVSVSGTGINNFNLINVDLGTSIANTLEVSSTHFSAPDNFLTLINGTFKMSGSYTLASTFVTGPDYNIDPTTCLWINNPNVTVTAQAGLVSVRGILRLSAGTFNVGTTIDNSLEYVTGSTLMIEGGTLNIAGRLYGNNPSATTNYVQSSGFVNVVQQGSTDPDFSGFDLGVAGSTFTMSGGTIVIANATGALASDYLNAASVATVTGGTLQIGDANTANAQTIRIQTTRPIGNLVVSGATGQTIKPTAQLISSSLNIVGNVTIESGTTLNAGGLNISLGGDWSNSGSFTNSNTVTFNGVSGQTLTNPIGEVFSNLTVNKAGSTLTLNNSATVSNSFTFTQGTISVGTNTLILNGVVSGAGSFTSAVNGIVNYSKGSANQTVLAGNYGNLVFSNFTKTLVSTGIIGISGTFTTGFAAGHTVTGSSIDFNGGSQSVPVFPYNNLILSGSGVKSGSGTMTVSGNLTNNTGIDFSGITTLNLNGPAHLNSGTLSAATLSIGPGSTVTNNGTINTSSSLTGSGSFNQGTTGILNIGGTVNISSFNSSATGNTVNYTGPSQTIAPVTYHHLTLSGSGPIILTGVNTVNGDFNLSGTVSLFATTGITTGGNFSIGSGTSFGAGSYTHILKGNWSNSGIFVAGSGTFILNGPIAQSMSGSEFNNLTIDNVSGVTMLTDEIVNGTLSLSSGTFSIGAHTLYLNGALSTGTGSLLGGTSSDIMIGGTGASLALPGITLNNLTLNRANGFSLGGDATINGLLSIVNGQLNTGVYRVILGSSGILSEAAGQTIIGEVYTTRNITATSGMETFGNIGTDIALNGVAPGNTAMLRKTGIASTGSGHNSILRYVDITPTTNTGLNADLVFHYDESELNGQIAGLLELYRSPDNGATWINLGGTVNTTLHTITVNGINDFSRWTAADTNNRIGNTASPAIINITPDSTGVGDPAFTLTVNGTGFINGKSTVRFNSSERTTTYVSSIQLTALIPASDQLIAGLFPVTVFNTGGGGLSNVQNLKVSPGIPATVCVETAADGSGAVVPAQSLVSGSTLTVYAISRDASNNFVENVAATSWALENITGGIVAGDLIPAVDGKSAVFTAHVVGTTNIKATSGVLATTPSGTITVTPGTPVAVKVETTANGSGSVVPAQSVASGSSITVYAITRDASDNFIENITATSWMLENITSGIVAGDLMAAFDGKSAVFTAHVTGTTDIKATSGLLVATPSGTITVTPGTPATVKVETSANGSGSVVPAQSVTSGSSVTVYAITRDSSDNFVENIAATSWTLENITGGVVAGDLVAAVDGKSAVLTAHVTGTTSIKAISGVLATTPSGTITVTPGTPVALIVETLANGSGSVVPAQSVASGSSVTVYAITRDASDNFVENIAATSWMLENITGGVVAGDLIPAVDGKSAVFTAHIVGTTNIKATFGVLATISSGIITVTPGTAIMVNVETTASGTGAVVPAQSVASGSSVTVYAITRDASDNFVENIAATSWMLENITGGVVAGDLVPAVDGKSAVFTAHVTGTTGIKALSGVLASTSSGTITVTTGPAAKIIVETASNGSGIIVPAQSVTAGSAFTVYAILRDASNNFIENTIATSWVLENITGGVVTGDLVPAVNGKSAVFTGHLVGTAVIKATSGGLVTTPSGTITVTPGVTTKIRVETAANGTGIVVPAQSLVSGSSITGYAIWRDAMNNFVANVTATSWVLENISGGVVAGDLVPAVNGKSAVFTGHLVGSAVIKATSGGLPTTTSGAITVTPGITTKVRVETAANGTGTVVPAQSLASGASITVYAIWRDAMNNFVANVTASSWVLENISGGVVAGDLIPAVNGKSAVFTGHLVGTADIKALSGGIPAVPSGVITVVPVATQIVQDVTVSNGQSNCYNASQTLYIAGSGTSFVVQSGGTATMIAGQNIFYLPGTKVDLGGNMHGYITVNNQYCSPPPAPANTVMAGDEEVPFNSSQNNFRVYPNPTTGKFTLDIKGETFIGRVNVEIFGMLGEKVLSSEIPGPGKHELTLSGNPVGIYIIRLISGDRIEICKIIKQ